MNKRQTYSICGELRSFMCGNGLRIYVLPRHEIPSVSIQAWVATGWMQEGEYLGSGLSHFLEHMLFQGTKDYPGNGISERVTALGGELNAGTFYDYTTFYINLPSRHVAEGIRMLDSMIREPLFPEADFLNEQKVILREQAMYKDSPVHTLQEGLSATLFRVSPARVPGIGYPEKFAVLTPEIMRKYHTERYTPERVSYVIVGDVEPEKIFEQLCMNVERWPRGTMTEPFQPEEPPCLFAREIHTVFPAPQSYYGAAWQTPAASHADQLATAAFTAILAGCDSSRLFEELVNIRKLALNVDFDTVALSRVGFSSLVLKTEPSKLTAAAQAAREIIAEFAEKGPSADEMKIFRNGQRFAYLQAMRSYAGTAQIIGRSLIHFNSPDAVDHYLPMLDALTAEDLIRIGKTYFREGTASVVIQEPAARNKQTVVPSKKQPVRPVRKVFPAGQRMIYLRDDSLPLTEISIRLAGGLLYEPEDKAYSLLLAEMLPSGNQVRDEKTFLHELDLHAVTLSVHAAEDCLEISASCPSEQTGFAVEMIGEMLGSPLFTEETLERERIQQMEAEKNRDQAPAAHAARALRTVLFKGHPYGYSHEQVLKRLKSVQVEELADFYHDICLTPGSAVIGFAGDITEQQAKRLTDKLIAACQWNDRKQLPPVPVPVFPGKNGQIKGSLPRQQAVVCTAFPGIALESEEYDLVDFVQTDCSSMASHLFDTVRNQNGLVYYASFMSWFGHGFPGALCYYGATTAEGAPVLKKLFDEEIRRLAEHGFTKKDFANTLQMILYRLDTSAAQPDVVLERLVNAEFCGIGWEASWHTRERYQALKLPEFNRRLKKLFADKVRVTSIVLPEKKEQDHVS